MTTVHIQVTLSGSSVRSSESTAVVLLGMSRKQAVLHDSYARWPNGKLEDGSLQRSQLSTFLCPPPFHCPRQQSGHFPGWSRHLLAKSTSEPRIESSGINFSIGGKASSGEKLPSHGQASVARFPAMISSYEGFGDSSELVDVLKFPGSVISKGFVASYGIFWASKSPWTSLLLPE